jgi:outer membrane protein OmpA-like peptidoglycan-associated protein
MRAPQYRHVVPIALLAALAACSKRDDVAPASTAQTAESADTSRNVAPAVCDMVTAEDMSGIVGAAVSAESENGVGSTKCRYQASGATFPYVEIQIDWGNGAVAMASTNLLGRLEPGISDPLAGLGDQASAVGPAFMIRVGDDFVNLTLMGVEDRVPMAKRIIDLMRPRMGPSAQPKAAVAEGSAAGDDTADSDAAAAAQAVGNVLAGIAAATNELKPPDDRSDEAASSNLSNLAERRAAADSATPVAKVRQAADEPALGPATGPPVRIPVVAGLTLVGAEHEPGRGDYEPIVTVSRVTPDLVSTVFSANLPEGNRLAVNRDVRRNDLRSAREYLSWYQQDDPRVFAGTTAFSLSTAVYTDLKTKGYADLVRRGSIDNPLVAFVQALGTSSDSSTPRHAGKLERLEPHAVAFPVLLNDELVHVHAIHARGTFDGATIDFHVLDDPENPLLLRMAGDSIGRIVRIAFPTPASAPIEKKLQDESRVALHGIYFDFGKDTIRPESEPVLREIATALTRHPGWKIGIEGHTDDIGGDALNLDLSRRRAEAVKRALVERYRVPAENLTTAGLGASKPTASNETPSGRALNRRVELVRS